MKNSKAQWARPQLIVLTRGTSAENVLTNCKTNNASGSSLGATGLQKQGDCAYEETVKNCRNCQSRGNALS